MPANWDIAEGESLAVRLQAGREFVLLAAGSSPMHLVAKSLVESGMYGTPQAFDDKTILVITVVIHGERS